MRIEQRLSALEAASRPARMRPLTTIERAVRLLNVLNGPDCQRRRAVVTLLERTGAMQVGGLEDRC